MDALTIVLLALAALLFLFYLFKVGKAKKLIGTADAALASGNDVEALKSYKKALDWANEKPDMELSIVGKIADIYRRRNIQHDFADFRALVEAGKPLLKKSSGKAGKEMAEINRLKKELIAKMPEIT